MTENDLAISSHFFYKTKTYYLVCFSLIFAAQKKNSNDQKLQTINMGLDFRYKRTYYIRFFPS